MAPKWLFVLASTANEVHIVRKTSQHSGYKTSERKLSLYQWQSPEDLSSIMTNLLMQDCYSFFLMCLKEKTYMQIKTCCNCSDSFMTSTWPVHINYQHASMAGQLQYIMWKLLPLVQSKITFMGKRRKLQGTNKREGCGESWRGRAEPV